MTDGKLVVRVDDGDEFLYSDPVAYGEVQIINDENTGTLIVVFYRQGDGRPTSKWIFSPKNWKSVCLLTEKEAAWKAG